MSRPVCSFSEVNLTCTGYNLSFLVWKWNGISIADFTMASPDGDSESKIIMNTNVTATLNSIQTRNDPSTNISATLYNSSLVIVLMNETMTAAQFGNITCGDHLYSCSKDFDELLDTGGIYIPTYTDH